MSDRNTDAGAGTPSAGSGRSTGGFRSAAGAWNPGARMAVVAMLGILSGADIWIFTAAKISSLPKVQVQLNPGGPVKVPASTFEG